MKKLINETLIISAQLIKKAENKKLKLTRRMLINDLKMIKLNLLLMENVMKENDIKR
tara:strand:+ start:234 stop:404 length:171 start_codon:yes stop_codon:yes gene_type:complete